MLQRPHYEAIAALNAQYPGRDTSLVNINLTSPPMLALKLSALAGAILTAPIWLYQVWVFVVPGLLAKERKWALIFIGAATCSSAALCRRRCDRLPHPAGDHRTAQGAVQPLSDDVAGYQADFSASDPFYDRGDDCDDPLSRVDSRPGAGEAPCRAAANPKVLVWPGQSRCTQAR